MEKRAVPVGVWGMYTDARKQIPYQWAFLGRIGYSRIGASVRFTATCTNGLILVTIGDATRLHPVGELWR